MGANTVRWDGMIAVAGERVAAPDGAYRVRVEVRDAAGNPATASTTVLVNSTLAAVTARPLFFSPNADGVQDASVLSFRLARQAAVTLSVVGGGDTCARGRWGRCRPALTSDAGTAPPPASRSRTAATRSW